MPNAKNGKFRKRKSNPVSSGHDYGFKPVGLVVFENGMVPERKNYAKQLTDALSGAFNMLQPINSGRDIWGVMLGSVPSIVVISQTLRDVDAINLINLLRLSDYCSETMFFLCVKRLNKSIRSVCENQRLDGVFSYTEPLDKTADEIAERYYAGIEELREKSFEKLMKEHGDINLLFDIEHNRISFDSMLSDILFPLGMSKTHKGTE